MRRKLLAYTHDDCRLASITGITGEHIAADQPKLKSVSEHSFDKPETAYSDIHSIRNQGGVLASVPIDSIDYFKYSSVKPTQ